MCQSSIGFTRGHGRNHRFARRYGGPLLPAAAVGASLALATGAAYAGVDCSAFPCGHNNNKVLICHVPPEDPADAHTICISPNAVPAHFANHEGDTCGECVAGAAAVYEGDLGGDQLVGIDDLLQLIGSWGKCPAEGCPADLDSDGEVGATDLLIILLNFD